MENLVFFLPKGLAHNLLSDNSEKKTQREVTYYEPVVIDRFGSVPGGRSAPLGLSLVWVYSLGLRRGSTGCKPRYVPNWATLKGMSVRLRPHDHIATNPYQGQENTMHKQIELWGQRFELYSLDKGRTWSSSPRSIVAYGQRKKMLRLELQKRFERIDEMQDPDPNNITEPEIPMSLVRR
jgi:hypothetical protein